LEARALGWSGEQSGLTPGESKRLADLMNTVHNIPDLVANWERCDETLLRQMLGAHDARKGAAGFALLPIYDRVVAEHATTSN
jgi:hypothetical protein